MNLSLSPSLPRPLGATELSDESWNFAVFSNFATAVDLCLFAPDDPAREIARIRLPGRSNSTWHGAVSGLEAGQHYGFRVHGPWKPNSGHRFNPAKLLLDPYAKAISGTLREHPAMTNPDESPDPRDSAAVMPKSVLVESSFDWDGDERPQVPANETVVYELHVRGFTKQFPCITDELAGTYAGLASEQAISYLQELGITTVQLMPVHHHIDDGFLLNRGLTNYWGYQTVGFFAPESRYAASDPSTGAHVDEFKTMVKRLHRAGIEVILDVVFNHTGEGGPEGPTVCFRGLDNHAYYRRIRVGHPGYRDFTGCGNTLDLRDPHVLQLVLDSLRYWVEEMHVDGFRFDLAASLGRESDGFSRDSAFFRAIHQDPVLSVVKLIAEPWDLGPGGYQVGGFPAGWSELNGKFRDTARRFWLGEPVAPEFAYRLTGSEDLYAASRRPPQASVNFITSHDGFTLLDLVSHHYKHNEANGEDNNDGDSQNHSANHGVEGATDDPAILDRRDQHRRNLLATLFLSQGTPFLLAGDEFGRTQGGNNNGYCQDNAISWLDWNIDERGEHLRKFVKRLIALRGERAVFRRTEFFHGAETGATGSRDIDWLDSQGTKHPFRGERPGLLQVLIEHQQLLIFNATDQTQKLKLPPGRWLREVDTSLTAGFVDDLAAIVADSLKIPAFSLHVLAHAENSK